MQEIVNQKNFNVGEIDPRVDARADLKIYYAGLELGENIATLPVGPLVRRPGTDYIDYARHVLLPVAIAADMLQIPEGGTDTDALAEDGTLFTTTSPMGAADMVILQFNFGAAVEIHLWDVIDFAAKDPLAAADPIPPVFVYPWPNANFNPAEGGIFGGEIP